MEVLIVLGIYILLTSFNRIEQSSYLLLISFRQLSKQFITLSLTWRVS